MCKHYTFKTFNISLPQLVQMNLTMSNFIIEKIYASHFLELYVTNQLHEEEPFFSNREYLNSSTKSRLFIKSTIYYSPHESLLVKLFHSLLLYPPSLRYIWTSFLYLYRFIPISLFHWRFLLKFLRNSSVRVWPASGINIFYFFTIISSELIVCIR